MEVLPLNSRLKSSQGRGGSCDEVYWKVRKYRGWCETAKNEGEAHRKINNGRSIDILWIKLDLLFQWRPQRREHGIRDCALGRRRQRWTAGTGVSGSHGLTGFGMKNPTENGWGGVCSREDSKGYPGRSRWTDGVGSPGEECRFRKVWRLDLTQTDNLLSDTHTE